MARSPLTLAAMATTALPDVDIRGARALTAGGSGRFDSAVLTLASGSELAVRVPTDAAAAHDAEAQLIALRALTPGVRDLLPFAAAEIVGTAPLEDAGRVVVTSYLDGYQVEAAQVPAGRGVAVEMGTALAALHALPPSVVRAAGLPERSPREARDALERLLDVVGRSGRVPVRLMVRWREAVEDDRVWGYESAVTLGGAHATSFVFRDDAHGVPRVAGLLDWQGLQMGDPALDLHWTESAPHAAHDVFAAYRASSVRSPDRALRTRARLHAELEFARWLAHGIESHDAAVIDDAAGLLDALSGGIGDDPLLAGLEGAGGADVSEAIALLDRVPRGPRDAADTSIHTDAFDPEELSLHADERWDAAPARGAGSDDTQPLEAGASDETQPLASPDDGSTAR
ncbi:phosphotransferase [Microbacterium sp. ZXX196]|uniref:phosphotransferase n=1 Tax=Microbacterium sp. ZXX196 TaxID=2609291 RepID=UPI0012B6E253|nr:phosphotransferase [Microbacterium sp. ZXX196]MTE22894.1 phosphotransferase [Microbacterium sp. ZXX196]